MDAGAVKTDFEVLGTTEHAGSEGSPAALLSVTFLGHARKVTRREYLDLFFAHPLRVLN
jgi:hypothetical protein